MQLQKTEDNCLWSSLEKETKHTTSFAYVDYFCKDYLLLPPHKDWRMRHSVSVELQS